MSKSRETQPFGFNFDAFGPGPFVMLEPWLKAQANMVAAMKGMSDHWYERRTADLAAVQKLASRLAGCTSFESLVDVQSQCASALTERMMADFAGLQEDVMSVSSSATSALGELGANSGLPKAPKPVA